MNKNKLIILCFLIVFSCKKNTRNLNLKETIIKYHLDLNSGYDLQNTNWKRNGKIYANKVSDSCLIILINKKGDTILTHLDKGIESWYLAKMIKTGKEIFVIRREYTPVELDSTKANYKSLSEAKVNYSYNDIDYPMDSYYRLDTINKKLEVVKLISKLEIEKKIKEKFHFKEKIKILASTNKYTYIAKDTLKDSQVYYQINTTYAPQKKENKWMLEPSVSTKSSDVYKMGIYKNNLTMHTESLADSFVNIPIDSLEDGTGRYSINLKYYLKFSCNTKINKRCLDEFVKLEVVLRNEAKKKDKVIQTFTDNTFFENQPFEIFKYKYGDYFIGVLPESGTDYQESIFRLDTINWKLDQVKHFNKKTDLKFTRYKRYKNSFISGDVKGYMTTFLEEYEIVKVKDGYRLITN
jgi:hypothetical protein